MMVKQPPIARPVSSTPMSSVFSQLTNSMKSGLALGSPTAPVPPIKDLSTSLASTLDFQNNCMNHTNYPPQQLEASSAVLSSSPLEFLESLSSSVGASTALASGNGGLTDFVASITNAIPMATSLATPVPSAPIAYPPKAQIRRQKMIYHCKFGEFGILEGQFTEPSGVAVTEDNEIIVADTNNHRIQVFDKDGNFKFQFGEVGKRDGQLLYPNRVAVVAKTGDIVVTERSPTHQVQIFTKFGQFIRKFGADILQHPRGVTTDNCGRIIVVECKVMRVVIFDMVGNVLNKFSCSRYTWSHASV